jgi:DNA-binding response OmpR family regulator
MTTILLIEDNENLRRKIAQILTIEGYRVLSAAQHQPQHREEAHQ